MRVARIIETKLKSEFSPSLLEIVDESSRHAGHSGSSPEGETHFRLHIVSNVFDGMSRVARQRLVYRVLAEELAGPIHALALTTETQAEHGKTYK